MAKVDRVRLTIPVSREVYDVFSRMASATGLPLGRTMAGWLEDTLDGAQWVAAEVERARSKPREVLEAIGGRARHIPPSSNTGGNTGKNPNTVV